MDTKNLEALAQGPQRVLPKLANLSKAPPSVAPRWVEGFRSIYGELCPGAGVKEYIVCAKIFQHAWHAKTSRDKEYIGRHLTAIFERESLPPQPEIPEGVLGFLPPLETSDPNDPQSRPAIVCDFATGTVEIKPRTLLDWLAKSLLEYRDRLAICECEGCQHPYFVREHARQQFCSKECADLVRGQKKERWWAENREKFLEKWRRERKAMRSKGTKLRNRRSGGRAKR